MTKDPKACTRCGKPHDRCKGHNRAGGPCQLRPMQEQAVCSMHGGKSPQALAKAQQRVLEREASRLLESIWDEDATPVMNPVGALQVLAGQLQHAVNALGARLGASDLDGVTAAAWLRVLRELRLALEGMERLDLDAREIELKEETAAFITAAFRGALAVVATSVLLPADRDLMVRTFLQLLGREPKAEFEGGDAE